MTNDLFRDLLDGLIPMARKRIKPGIYFLPSLRDPTAPTVAEMNAGIDLSQFITIDGYSVQPHVHCAPSDGWLDCCDKPGYDPRYVALAAKQSRGTGPTPEALRVRGRNNHYRTKG